MIRVSDIYYEIGDFKLNVSLKLGQKEYFVLFGMTGCGKTSLLECLCGLREISNGKIFVGDEDVTFAIPRSRRIGYVPQDGALFVYLNVRDNIGFSLKVKGIDRQQRKQAVNQVAQKLGIEHLLDRQIPGLSGGERQRVALARALVSRPKALLLDEPVSALDEFTRDTICQELVKINKEMQIPVIHVCHSFEEARLVADRIGVMHKGEIIQIGSPAELIEHPRNIYVARILRLENIFSGTGIKKDGGIYLKIQDFAFRASVPEGPVDVIIQPWKVSVVSEISEVNKTDVNIVEGTIRELSPLGSFFKLQINGVLPLITHITHRKAEETGFAPGQKVKLSFPKDAVCVIETSSCRNDYVNV